MVRAAACLDVLLTQINIIAPHRNKASDGGLASSAHHVANPSSDHEEDDKGVYHARDFTHDPANGADMSKWVKPVALDPRCAYAIFAGLFYDVVKGQLRVRDYRKVNPKATNMHDHHMHVSSVYGAAGESRAPWALGVNNPIDSENDMPWSDGELAKIDEIATNAYQTRVLAGSARDEVRGVAGQVAGLVNLVAQIVASGSNDLTAAQVEQLSHDGAQRAINERINSAEVNLKVDKA